MAKKQACCAGCRRRPFPMQLHQQAKSSPPEKSCMPRVMCRMSRVMCRMSHVMCHMSHVTCHMSHVTYHMSHVTCHLSHVTKILINLKKKEEKVAELVGRGSVINGAYPV